MCSIRRVVVGVLLAFTLAITPLRGAAGSPAIGRTLKSDYVIEHVFLAAAVDADKRAADGAEHEDNFLDWYQDGVRSYLAGYWERCVRHLEQALAGYHDYYQATASCRIKCRNVAAAVPPLFEQDVGDMQYYESIVRRTLCLIKCKQLLLPMYAANFQMDGWSQEVFRSVKPYSYLQMCYFKNGDILKATHATYTALLRNPNDAMMSSNLQWYLKQLPNDTRIEDLEQWKFAEFYLEAVRAYNEENFTAVVENMERSLSMFLYESDECRAYCEGDYSNGWTPDFVMSTANHFTYGLRCKLNCSDNLSIIRGKLYENIFASHYEYLHISYYNVNRTHKACRAAASYLHILPDSEQMLQNLAFYQKGKLVACAPRKESELYAAQHRYEERLLEFITKEFRQERTTISQRKLQAIRNNATALEQILRQD